MNVNNSFIKNIIFDLGGVILKEKPISTLKKIDIDDKTYNDLKRFFDDWENLDLGNELLEDKYNKCNFSYEYKVYKDFLINHYEYRDINLEILNLIKLLKQNNYNVYILSDNNKDTYNYYKNSLDFKDIDGWVVSCDYNSLKKDGILFDILINKFNLNTGECYFIDDNPINIEEAYKHGIKGYIFNEKDDINKLYDDMKNEGILVE